MPANHDRDESVTSPRHPVGKKPLRVRVIFLDGRAENFLLSPRCPGQEFFDLVVQKLQLDDTDYFDLEYEDSLGNRCWLDHFKPLYKPVSQITRRPALFSFKVKFYTPNLSLLSNRLTRRLFALQIKRDLIDGELHCGENTGALLAAFILQGKDVH
ncbi:FERM, ARHGEF and pleckstrin domain-containing protein 1 [Sparganum proliferum]